MTTIVANREEMACESLVSCASGEAYTTDQKVRRVGDDIVGCAGNITDIMKFMEWYASRGDRPELENIDALVLNSSGLWIYNSSTYANRVCDPFICIGSGAMAAKAAMLCGKSPREAVAIAIQCDKGSGGKVRNYRLTD